MFMVCFLGLSIEGRNHKSGMLTLSDLSKPNCTSSSLKRFSAMSWRPSRDTFALARQSEMHPRWTVRTALYKSFWAGVNLPDTGHVRVMSVM